jgi:hypothetical protein
MPGEEDAPTFLDRELTHTAPPAGIRWLDVPLG